MKNIKEEIRKLAKEFSGEIIALRREIHRFPELSRQEKRTMELVCNRLNEWGISFEKQVGGYGVVAVLESNRKTRNTIAFRADMDALPVEEKTGLPFASQVPGVMHACGHDMHTASLLGTAKILQHLKGQLDRNVKLIFQPSEEVLPGGAKPMIEAGVLKDPDVHIIAGQHVFPELEPGEVGIKPGPYMASSDEIYLTVKGRGGHAALPGNIINPLYIASEVLLALREFSARYSRPDSPVVLSFGGISANGQMNVVPDEVSISGILRTFDEKVRKTLKREIIQTANTIARNNKAEVEVDFVESYPALKNDEELTQKFIRLATGYLGEGKVKPLPLRATTDDFAYFIQRIPGIYYRFGAGKKAGRLHSPDFNPSEDSLAVNAGLMTYLAFFLD